jgi:hypothetical protein
MLNTTKAFSQMLCVVRKVHRDVVRNHRARMLRADTAIYAAVQHR